MVRNEHGLLVLPVLKEFGYDFSIFDYGIAPSESHERHSPTMTKKNRNTALFLFLFIEQPLNR
jgi:hypothetical protein